MGAVVYALPATLPFAQATVHALPKRTPSGHQEALPLEWPNSPAPDPIVLRAPRAGIDTLHSFDPQPTRSCDLPPAGPWAMRLVHGMVEVINGVRPASQLTRWVTVDVLSQIHERVIGSSMPRFGVRSVHVTETDDGIAEVCSVFGTQNRSFALALRLEGLDGRWRATSLVCAI